MTRSISLLAILFSLLFITSCDTNDDYYDYITNGDFTVTGIHDVNLSQLGSASLQLDVKAGGGTRTPVSIKVEDLPAGVSALISTPSGTPDFSTVITFNSVGAATGSYPVRVVASSSNKTKEYTLTLNVGISSSCRDGILGDKTCTESSTVRGIVGPYTATISADPDFDNRVRISNLGNFSTSVSVYADLDCITGSLYIPAQIVNGNIYESQVGTFGNGKLFITYSVKDGLGNPLEQSTVEMQ